MKAIRTSLLASLAAALFSVMPASASNFLDGAVSRFPVNWSVSGEAQPGDVATRSGSGDTLTLAFDLGDDQTLTYTAPTASDANGTADVVISNAVFTTAFEYPGVEAVGGIDSQAAICVYTNTTSGGALKYYGWAGAYKVENDVTNLTWFALSGATPVEGATNTVTMSFDYTASPATVTFKVGNTTLTPNPVQLVNNTRTQVSGVSFSGTGSIGEMAGQSAPPAPSTFLVTFYTNDLATASWTTNVPANTVPVYLAAEPTKAPTAEYTYTFAGWTNETVAVATKTLSDPVTAPTNYYAAFTATPVSYTLTWNLDGGTITSEAGMYTAAGQVPFGTALSAPTVTKTGYTFGGWDSEVPQTMPAANETYTAQWTPNANTAYTVKHYFQNLALDGYAQNTTDYPDQSLTGTTAQSTVATAHTVAGFTPKTITQETIAADGSTVVSVYYDRNKYTITWVDGNGNTIETDSDVPYGAMPTYNGATPTKDATAEYTYTFNNSWSPSVGPVTGAQTYTAQFDSTPVSYTLSWVTDGDELTGTYTSGSVPFGTTIVPPNQPTKTGATFKAWNPMVAATMPAANTTYTATWTVDTFTVYWVVNDETVETDNDVAYNTQAHFDGATPTKTSSATTDFNFSGWSDGTTIYAANALPPVTDNVTFTAQFSEVARPYTLAWDAAGGNLSGEYTAAGSVANGAEITAPTATRDGYTFDGWSPEFTGTMPTADTTYVAQWSKIVVPTLALAKPTLSSTVLANAQSGAVVRATIDPAAEVTGASATAGVSVDVDGATATFTSLPWNEAVDWTLSSTGAADLPGRFYAKGETTWFNVATDALQTVTGLAENMKGVEAPAPSAAGQMVRIQTCLEIGEGGMEELPDSTGVGDARTGFAVAKLSGDEAAAFYAFNGSTWDKLLGATPVANTTNDLLIVLDVEAATARYYVEGIALYKDNAGTPVYAIPMKTFEADETKQINGIGFANADGVKAPVVAEYDVPFEAAIGDVPYATADAGVAAVAKDGTQTLALLTNGYAGTITLAVGESVKVDTAKGSFASATPVVTTAGAGYEVVATADGDVTTYTVGLVEYPIVWNLDLAGATNAVANALTNSYTVADLPITLFPAGCVDYTFDGWTNNVAAGVQTTIPAGTTGAVTNWATWHRNAFTITWNVEGVTTTSEVLPGVVPSFTGTPEKAADNTYTYTFAGWAESSGGSVIALPEASADATYFAVFTPVYINYTITWNYVDPTTGNMTSDQTTVHWGQTPSHADPAGYVANNTIYAFDDWNVEPAAYDGTVTAYTATYTSAAAEAMVISVADAETGATTTNYVATLAAAFGANGAKDGDTVELLANVTLAERVEPNVGANTAITIDLGGYTITREGTSGNGSVFDVKSGDVTITNGVIVCTQDDTAIAKDGVYAITSRSGSNVTLADLAVTVNSECGACAYPFAGSTMTIESGTYANLTTTPYRYNTAITGMAVNQPNDATQNLFIKGGSFSQYDPQLGDDSGAMTDFTDDGFVAIDDGNGHWIVQPGYNVTFDANGGTPTPPAQRIPAGETATAPTAPAAENLDFLGWFASGATDAYDFTAEVTADLVLTAAWDVSYTAAFDKDAYTATGGGVMSMKVAIVRADGATLTTDDKDGWTVEYDSARLETSGTPVWSLSTGTVTYKAKRNDAGFDTATGTVSLKRGGKVYDTATISVDPSATWTFSPSGTHMVEGGAISVATLKVNGVTVDLADYAVASDNAALATIAQDGSSATVTPVSSGKATFTLADGNGATLPLSVTFIDAAAKIGSTYYDTIAKAMKAAASGDTVELCRDVTESVNFSGNTPRVDGFALTIDLAGHTWTGGTSNPYALRVDYGTITVKDTVGGGGVAYGTDYAFIVSHLAGAYTSKLVLESGAFSGKTSVAQVGMSGGSGSNKKYYGGTLEILGGTFEAVLDDGETLDADGHMRYLLNELDFSASEYPGGEYSPSEIVVKGGSFKQFDPADNVAEGADTSFLPATGYVSVADDPSSGWYTVYEAVTVSFVNDKGAAPEAQVIGKGKTATKPADPAAVAGFRFDGWFAEGAEEAFDFTTSVAADLTLTAKWTPTTATVIWVVEETQTAETYDIGATPVYPGATPTKAGTDSSVYVFTGWSPALGEVTAAGATYTAQFSLVSLSPASLELYPNCSNYVQVAGAPAGSTYTYKFAGQVGCDSYALNPPGWSKTEGWAWPYGKQPGGTGTITVTVTNDNAQIAVLTANVTVKDVAAVVDGVEYASADFANALAAAKSGDKVLEMYYYMSSYGKVALAEGESIRWKPADNRGKGSFWTSAATIPATTDAAWYEAVASKDNETGVTTITCVNQGVPYVKIDDGTTVTYSTKSFTSMNKAGTTYTLLRDMTDQTGGVVNKAGVILDLNGKKLGLATGIKVAVNSAASLTIRDTSQAGTGEISGGNDSSPLVWVTGGGTATIESGTFVSDGTTAVYTENGTASITGGTFSTTAADKTFLLNCKDSNKETITVTGGSFQGFNPQNNTADGEGTDYVATGYVSVANDPSSGWYTVYEAVTVTFADEKVSPPEAQTIGKGKTATEPTAPTFTGWTFEGWYTNLVAGEAWDFDDPVVEDITLTAKWTQNEYDVIWVADGAQFASNRVAHGTAMPVPAENPAKAGDENALYTFVAWTPAQDATVTSNATYTAEFKTWTKIAVPTAAANLVYTGAEQTGVAAGTGYTLSGDAVGTDAGDYTATASLADAENTVWADSTEVNAAATTAKTIEWSIDKAPLSALAVALQGWIENETPSTPVVSGNAGGGAETITYWSGETQLAAQPMTRGTYKVKVDVAETDNYLSGSATATFTINAPNEYTVIWVVENAEPEQQSLEAGTTPTHAVPEKTDATGKYAWTFAGWNDGTTQYGPTDTLPEVSGEVTYTATFTQSIATSLALPLADHEVDATVNGLAATVAIAPTGTIAGVTYTAAPAAAWNEATTSFSFEGLAWNEGTNWTVDAAQGADALAETAHNEGAFYAKASVELFSASPNDFKEFDDLGIASVGYASEVASAAGEAVRVHTTIDVPEGGLESAPEVGTSKAGFAVLQLANDTKPAFYAYNAGTDGPGTWTKLYGVEPKAGEADYLAVYDFAAAEPAVRYYIDGVPLYAAGDNDTKVYAIPLVGMTSLSTVAFGDAAMVKDDVVAVQDVSYVAAVGETPYTNIVEALAAVTAAEKAEANEVTLSLLKANLDPGATTVALAAGEAVTVDATSGSFAGDAPFVAAGAPAYKVVTTGTAPILTYKVELNLATVIWLAEDGTTEVWRTNAVIGTVPVYEGPAQTKDATAEALYTFSGWTNAAGVAYAPTDAFPAVAIGGTNYVATFKTWTKVVRPTVASGLEYTGHEQTGVTVAAGSTATGVTAATAAGSYSATVSLDSADSVWADATDPAAAAARETVTANWSIARKPVTVTAQAASKIAGNADPELTATVDGTVGDDTVSYTVTRVAGETAGEYAITATGDAEQGNYAVTFTGATFTITGAQAMVISVADAETGATTTNYVDTLAAAVENVATGETIVLLADVNEAIVNTADKDFTIDLNGKTWSSPSDVLTTTAGTITIEATNGGTMTTEAAECCAVWAKGGDVVINGGTFLSKDTKEATIYVSHADSVVTINGGTFQNTAEGDYAYAAGNKVDKPLTLNVKNDLTGEAHIILNGGTFYGNDPMLGDDHIAVTDAAGQFVASDYFAVSEGGVFTVVPRIDIAPAVVTLADDLVYNGTAQAGVISVVYAGTNLVEGTDYVVTYADNVAAGEDTAAATIVGTNLWTGTIAETFSIAKRGATFTAESASKVYDGQPLSTNDFAVAGLVAGHTATATVTGIQTDVGASSNKVSQAVVLDGQNNDVTANYAITYVDGELEVTPAAMAITIAGVDSTAVYTGSEQTTNVAWTATSETVGFVATKVSYTGEVSVAGTTVGDYAYYLDATKFVYADDNFTATFTVSADGKFTITPAEITITVAGWNGTYDGTAHPAEVETVPADATILWQVDGGEWTADTPSVKDVGSKEVRAKASKANYADATSEVVTLAVTKAPLSVAAKAFEITYGDAPANGGVTYAGFVGEEDESVLGGTLAYAYTYEQFGDVGTAYTITPSGLTSDNYDISYTAGTLTVVAKEVGLAWSPDPAKFTYDGKAHAPTATATGLVNGDEVAVTVEGEQTNAGTGYTATATGLTGAKAGNYKLPTAATTTFDIEPAAMTIEVAGYNGVYDGAAHVASATTVPAGATITWSVDSGAFTDAVPSVTGVTNVTIVAKATLENYADATATTSLVVTAKAITITADNKTKVYDNDAATDPELTATVTNAVAGDTINYTVSREAGQAVADYTITVTAGANPNYAVTVEPGTFSITPATVAIPAAPANKVYTSGVLTADVSSADTYTVVNEGGKDAGNYTVTFALADTTNYTWSDGSITNQVFGWSITKAPLTLTADDKTVAHGAAAPAYTYTPTGLLGSDTLATEPTLSCAYAAGDAVGPYPITIAGAVAPNYAITYANGTLTVVSNTFTVIWLADDGTTEIDTTQVEWGETPTHADAIKASDGKYAYEFKAWTPAPGPVTEATNFVASFTQKIETPLALPLDPHTTDAAVDAAARKATVDLGPVGTIDGVTYTPSPAAAWDGDTATFSFSGLAWNQATNWSVSAQQGADAFAETAYNEGAFYAKPKTSWFTATTNQLEAVADASDAAVAYTNAVASNEGEMVRIHTKVAVPAVGLSAAPAHGSAKVGFAVLQLDGDAESAYYAFGNGTWTKLSGAKPTEGDHDYLAVYDLASETPTARYYIDGVALYEAVDGGDDVYALPLAAGTTSLKSISFASKEMVKDDIVAEQDVSYVAAVGETPYTDAEAAVTAQGKDPAKTMALLKQNVGIAPVSLAATTEKFVVDYTLGSFTNDNPAVSGVAGYAVKETVDAGNDKLKTYALDPVVYPIDYVLALASATNAVENPATYTVETLPVEFLAAGAPGYTFEGWTNAAGAQVTGLAANTTGAVTNYASWQLVTYNIAYTLNGGATDPVDANPATYTVESPAIALVSPTKTGYTFAGWTGTGLGDATNVAVTIPAGSTGDRAYTATWTPALVDYTVKHLQQSVDGQSYIEVEGDRETKQGYTGSQTEAVANTYTGFQAGVFQQAEIAADGSTVVEIKYDRASFTLTIAYVKTNGTEVATQFTSNVVYGAAYSVDSPAVDYYTAVPATVAGTMGAAAVTTNVVYTATPFAIAYDLAGGATDPADANPTSYTVETETFTLVNPTKDGFTFAGWTGTGINGDPATTVMVAKGSSGDRSYVATWAENTVTVIHIADNGDGTATTNVTGYVTLAEAIAAAEDGDTVQLLADIEEPAVAIEDDITLDLNGSTWTVPTERDEEGYLTTEPIAITAAVVVTDSSENGGGSIKSIASPAVTVAGTGASLTVGTGATIASTDGEGGFDGDAVEVDAGGAVVVDGGTVKGTVAVAEDATGAGVTVKGGSVDEIYVNDGASATVAVTGGEVVDGIIAVDDDQTAGATAATVTVAGGTVGGGVQIPAGSTLEVSAGTVEGISGEGAVTVSGGTVNDGIFSGGTVTVTGGTVNPREAAGGVTPPAIVAGGTATISGGTVNGDVNAIVGGDVTVSGAATVTGGVSATGDGSTVAVEGGTVSGGVSVAEGGDATVTGGTVAGGVSATGEGSTVEVEGGTVNGQLAAGEGDGSSIAVSGGHFENDPSDYVADGYVAVPNTTDGGYDVTARKSVIGTTITVAGGTYNGSAYEISSIVLGDYTLTADDYTVVYTNLIDGVETNDNVNAGTVTATVTGKGEWIDSTNVTFTITKATLTITADDITVPLHTPADAVPYTFSYSGFVNGETNTVLSAQPTATTESPVYTASTAKGTTCTIVPSGAAAANYYIAYVNGTLTVGDAEAPTMLETTAITVAGTDVTLLHKIQSDAAYHTFFTCTDLKTGAWVAAENSRATADIETVEVEDAEGVKYTAGTVTFHNVTDNVRFYQIGYSSLPYTAGEAMGEKPADAGDEEP